MQQKMIANCPLCQNRSLNVITTTQKIPYFGEVLEFASICKNCGYRDSDILCLESKEPMRYSIDVHLETLNARVVKSQSATIRIPELGLKVEPGPKSQGYISNIEGVLNRFEEVIESSKILFKDKKTRVKIKEISKKLKEVKNGKRKVKMILEDPLGQSFIDHPEVSKRKLTEEEIKNLKTGFIEL